MSTDRIMDKENVGCVCVHTCVYTHTHTHKYIHTMKYYSAITKKEILPFATTCTELEGIVLSEINLTEKTNTVMISLICGIQKS